MRIVDFTMDDARKCADLIALLTATNKLIDSLKLAGIRVEGQSASSKEAVLAWVKELATQMANDIVEKDKKSAAPAPQAPQSSPVAQAAPKGKKSKAPVAKVRKAKS